jgi:hypothetical protein
VLSKATLSSDRSRIVTATAVEASPAATGGALLGQVILIGGADVCGRNPRLSWRVYQLAKEVAAVPRSFQNQLSILDEVLQAQARHSRVRRSTVAAAIVLLAVFAVRWPATIQSPPRSARAVPTGAVTGYIQPCNALGIPLHTSTGALLFSAAATVEALRGREHWKPVGHGTWLLVLPVSVAARESVAQNQQFRLGHLAPGRYVIRARYSGGNVSTYLTVLVGPGKVADVDLPNICM